MIEDDAAFQVAQGRVLLFERVLAEAHRSYSPSNYKAMAEGYLAEIDKIQAEIREYLGRLPEPIEAA